MEQIRQCRRIYFQGHILSRLVGQQIPNYIHLNLTVPKSVMAILSLCVQLYYPQYDRKQTGA